MPHLREKRCASRWHLTWPGHLRFTSNPTFTRGYPLRQIFVTSNTRRHSLRKGAPASAFIKPRRCQLELSVLRVSYEVHSRGGPLLFALLRRRHFCRSEWFQFCPSNRNIEEHVANRITVSSPTVGQQRFRHDKRYGRFAALKLY